MTIMPMCSIRHWMKEYARPTLHNHLQPTKNALYDSYIRAIRWSSDRIKDCGVIGFVTNGGFIEANTADGLRKCLVEEFSNLYIFHLRGNQRTSGERSRKEGGKIFWLRKPFTHSNISAGQKTLKQKSTEKSISMTLVIT